MTALIGANCAVLCRACSRLIPRAVDILKLASAGIRDHHGPETYISRCACMYARRMALMRVWYPRSRRNQGSRSASQHFSAYIRPAISLAAFSTAGVIVAMVRGSPMATMVSPLRT